MSIRINSLPIQDREDAKGRYSDAWRAFKRHMRGRQYGREELWDAWHMYRAGWVASGFR